MASTAAHNFSTNLGPQSLVHPSSHGDQQESERVENSLYLQTALIQSSQQRLVSGPYAVWP